MEKKTPELDAFISVKKQKTQKTTTHKPAEERVEKKERRPVDPPVAKTIDAGAAAVADKLMTDVLISNAGLKEAYTSFCVFTGAHMLTQGLNPAMDAIIENFKYADFLTFLDNFHRGLTMEGAGLQKVLGLARQADFRIYYLSMDSKAPLQLDVGGINRCWLSKGRPMGTPRNVPTLCGYVSGGAMEYSLVSSGVGHILVSYNYICNIAIRTAEMLSKFWATMYPDFATFDNATYNAACNEFVAKIPTFDAMYAGFCRQLAILCTAFKTKFAFVHK